MWKEKSKKVYKGAITVTFIYLYDRKFKLIDKTFCGKSISGEPRPNLKVRQWTLSGCVGYYYGHMIAILIS